VEQECLAVLLRGPGPVIVCPAHGLARKRLKREYKEPMAAGRLLLTSPFGEKVRRLTADTALTRNRFVAALADTVLIAHAQPGLQVHVLVGDVLAGGALVHHAQGQVAQTAHGSLELVHRDAEGGGGVLVALPLPLLVPDAGTTQALPKTSTNSTRIHT